MALINPREEKEDEEQTGQMQTDITDEEMALRYQHMVHFLREQYVTEEIFFPCISGTRV